MERCRELYLEELSERRKREARQAENNKSKTPAR
jgi:hypothetical protein